MNSEVSLIPASKHLELFADATPTRPIVVCSTAAGAERLSVKFSEQLTPVIFTGKHASKFDASAFRDYEFIVLLDHTPGWRTVGTQLGASLLNSKVAKVELYHCDDLPDWQLEDHALDIVDFFAWGRRDDRQHTKVLSVPREVNKHLTKENAPQGKEYKTRQRWRELNLSEANGKCAPNIDNALRILTGNEIPIWYDEFLQRGMTSWNTATRELRDSDMVDLTVYIQRELEIPNMTLRTVEAAVQSYQRINVRNSAQDWMRAQIWDGESRLDKVCPLGFGTPDDDYYRAVGRCFIMSIVKRVMEPGSQVDTVPVFEGPEGLRKSTALRIIGGNWFTECHEEITGKDFLQIMPGKMLVEISELYSFKRAEIERIKGIITNRIDRYRPSYGRIAVDHPRMCVFAGTTNRNDWNGSDTGARRFWPVACGQIDLQWLKDNRSLLFAEAFIRVMAGDAHWDVPAETAKEMVAMRRSDDPWAAAIQKYLMSRNETSVDAILDDVLDIPMERRDQGAAARVRSVLRLSGFDGMTKWVSGKSQWMWVRKNPYVFRQTEEPQPPAPAEPDGWSDDIPF